MYGTAILGAFEAPLEALATCHRRIEMHLAALELLPEHVAEHGADATAREAARFALRFFDTAGADHQRDEEDDLFPLLRSRAGELQRAEISAVINELDADHHTLDLQWTRLRARLNVIAQGRLAPLGAADVSGFAWLYRRHLEKESAIVLPFAREALSTEECEELGKRMAVRRHERV